MSTETSDVTKRQSFWRPGRGSRTIGSWMVVVVFALLFADDVWEALGNVVGILNQHFSFGIALPGTAWAFLVLNLVAPFILFFGSLFLTRKMTAWKALTVFAVAVMVSAVIAQDITILGRYGNILG